MRQPFHGFRAEFGADGGDHLRIGVPDVDNHRREQNGDDGRRDDAPAFGPADDDAQGEQTEGEALPFGIRKMGHDTPKLRERFGRQFDVEAEELLHLPNRDDDGDAAGEPRDDRVGDELDEPPQAKRTDGKEEHPGHHRRQCQPFVTVGGGNGEKNRHERPGGPADLHKAAAKRGDQEACNDGGPESLAWGDAGSDAKADGERQGDDADGDPRNHIRQKHLAAVTAKGVD